MATQSTIPSQPMIESIGQRQWYTRQSASSTGSSDRSQISYTKWEMSCLPLKLVGPPYQHELGHFISRSCTLSPTHSFATLPFSLHPKEQGWTLELERERIRRGLEKEKKRREWSTSTTPWKPSTSSTVFMVSSRREVLFLGFSSQV